MKKVLATAVIVMSLMACNSGSNSETTSDTSTTTIGGDTLNPTPGTIDTTSLNTGDSTGINRDTSRADKTRLKKNTDTSRRRSD